MKNIHNMGWSVGYELLYKDSVKRDSIIALYPYINSWYNAVKLASIGKFEDVKKLLAIDEMQAAINNSNSMASSNLIYQNLKNLAILYANNLISSDSIPTDSNVIFTLNELAYQDPTLGGEAVWMARAILRKDVFATWNNLKVFETKELKSISVPLTISIYPNPTSGDFQLKCTQEYSKILVCNNLGTKVLDIPIASYKTLQQLSLETLPDGLYVIKLYNGSNEVANIKIAIIK